MVSRKDLRRAHLDGGRPPALPRRVGYTEKAGLDQAAPARRKGGFSVRPQYRIIHMMILATLLLLGQEPHVEIDYSKIERRIAKEPTYASTPEYALFILDPKGEFRAWAVLDRSRKGLDWPDVLYFDLNGNGDLTETRERFVQAPINPEMFDAAGGFGWVDIPVGDIPVPGTSLKHTQAKIYMHVARGCAPTIRFFLKWDGQVGMAAGWATRSFFKDDTSVSTPWGNSPATAPVFRPTIHGPIAFGYYLAGPDGAELKIGGTTEVRLVAGPRGSNADALAALPETWIDLARDRIVLTLQTKRPDGSEVREQSQVQGHC